MSQIPLVSIPDNWKIERLDRLFQIRNEPARIDDPPVSAFIDGTVTLRSNRPDAIIKGSGQEIGYKHIEIGDLVISGMNAHLGGLGISDSSGKCTPVYTVMKKTIDLDSRFISYYLWHAAKSGYIKSLVNAVRYNSADFGPETIKRFMVPVPPIEEQRRIADYLDKLLHTIDRAIELRRAQISNERTLQEMTRKSLVWPEKIELMPLKYITTLSYGDALPSDDRTDGEFPVMSSGGISGSHSIANTHAPVIVVGRKGSFGSVHWSDEPAFVIDTAYFVDDRNTQVHLKWLYHLLKSCDLNMYSVDVGIPGLSRENTYAKLVPRPPDPHSQLMLVKEIDEAMVKFNHKIVKLEKSIELLSEYKSSLITSLVSGASIQNRKYWK